ncbi:MAG: helix-turn-helix domain-containing protein [Actinomycetota bacterium]|nr:helix-turn-helix domain-containing protein [Actinomycetota bacterium]
MTADTEKGSKAAPTADPATLEALSEAIESGAGLPAVARAAAKVLGTSVAVIDRSSVVLAVAAASSSEEGKLLGNGEGVDSVELRVADSVVGELRFRSKGGASSGAPLARMVSALLALEVERSRSGDWASDEAAGEFVSAVLERRVTDRGDIVARAAEVGADLDDGSGVIVARAHPHVAQDGDWRARVLTVSLRVLRTQAQGSVAVVADGDAAEVRALVPAADAGVLGRAAKALSGELRHSLQGFRVTVAHSRLAQDPVDLYRAGKEAILATNVAEAEGTKVLAFEDTGSYRLLLPAMSEDESELERFYSETVAPLSAYDEQYETELVATVEAYLDNDGNVTPTAETMFTHRHTIRYRLERVRDLCGHDITLTEGREKLGLGLKAMRVLGIAAPKGPAMEAGARGGKVRRPKGSE